LYFLMFRKNNLLTAVCRPLDLFVNYHFKYLDDTHPVSEITSTLLQPPTSSTTFTLVPLSITRLTGLEVPAPLLRFKEVVTVFTSEFNCFLYSSQGNRLLGSALRLGAMSRCRTTSVIP